MGEVFLIRSWIGFGRKAACRRVVSHANQPTGQALIIIHRSLMYQFKTRLYSFNEGMILGV